jgi:hypothetical protein
MKMKKVNSDLSQEERDVNHGSRARITLTRALELLKSLTLFDPLIRTADRFAEILRDFGLGAEMISGVCSDRAEKLDRFRIGTTQILVNSMLRPTRIRSLFCQMTGRGTRIHPGKKDLLLLDFLWHSRRHNLARPASLISHDEAEEERISRALRRGDGDLIAAQSAAAREREQALAAELEENRQRPGETIDLLELAERFQAPAFVDYQPCMRWHSATVSEGQIRVLKNNGVDLRLVRDRGHAAVIIDGIFKFKELEPATEKQRRYMRRLGHPDPWRLTKREAARWISEQKTLKPQEQHMEVMS